MKPLADDSHWKKIITTVHCGFYQLIMDHNAE